jgi:mitochondrial division protein 1
MITNAANASTRARSSSSHDDSSHRLDFAALSRAPLRITMTKRRITSRDLEIVEVTDELLDTDVPEPEDLAQNVSLLRGFNATMPSSGQGKERRRRARNLNVPKASLRKLGMASDRRDERESLAEADKGPTVVSEDDDDLVVVGHETESRHKARRRGKGRLNLTKTLGKEELNRQKKEILRDKENIHVRRVRSSLPLNSPRS